ncbi:MAG: glycosyltransferase family 4 protein [Planctomycetota bacterium]
MRILHVITRLIIGGAQENTLLSVKGLLDRGHDVLLVTGPAPGPEGDLFEQARAWDVPTIILDELCREINPVRDARALVKLERVLVRRRPDVVHTHSSKAGIVGRLAARIARVPVIIHTIHGTSFGSHEPAWRNALFRAAERSCACWTDRIVTVADAMIEESLAARTAPRSKFLTVYSGMDVEPFLESERLRGDARKRFGFRDDEVVVGKIARLFEFKGHEDVLRAAQAACREVPNLHLLFVGDGILRGRLEELAVELGVREKVVFAGLLPPSEIPEAIAAMDVVVHASLREGLARALPQALLSGRPAIAYALDGAPEVVLPDKTGILVQPGDVGELARAMVKLTRDAGARAAMGKLGRELFRDQFRAEVMVQRLEELYRAELSRKSARRFSR